MKYTVKKIDPVNQHLKCTQCILYSVKLLFDAKVSCLITNVRSRVFWREFRVILRELPFMSGKLHNNLPTYAFICKSDAST